MIRTQVSRSGRAGISARAKLLRSAVAAFAVIAVLACAGIAFAAPPVAPTDAMLAPAQRWIDAFNAAQPLPEDVFTDDVVITDQFAPYSWSGREGAHAWTAAINSGLHTPRIKNQHVVTETPRAFMVNRTEDRVTFVLPATLTYALDGTPKTYRALWLFVMVKSGDRWRIAADTWTRTE